MLNIVIPVYILAIENDFDRDFMTSLYLNYRGLIISHISSFIGISDTTEDLVQETLISLIGKVNLLESLDERRLVAYIIETAKNTARSYLRKNRELILSIEDFSHISDADRSVEEKVIGEINVEAMRRVWYALPEDVQTIFRMKYFLKMTNEEIAAECHIKPDSVRMKLTRAKRKLLQLLNDSESNER